VTTSDDPAAARLEVPEPVGIAVVPQTCHNEVADHDIRIEDGTGDGRQIGQVTAEAGHERLSWTIPADAEPESIIRYFCARHGNLG
jgi:hypothetical protein